ncbi:uncharacterized protein SRS1_13313 [Sporisorium reilianum f. sp. reilianum]|uniref:Uncharacterized protein n=1 Tax=Sporisorium reilianum f. sp. reilianum TaxID=72559 RepID=A0A2N8UDL2_9BASI|nr:uncharacterized protein SRS1_13313 [Sporisorium reilianum f. sp. reilianum]
MEDAFAQMCSVSSSADQPTPKSIASEARTLRRRRSAASAALLSRPSMLTLGELVPSFETCVLVYISTPPASDTATARLVYALFEPNFLVDGTRAHIRKLDRAAWERLRSHVEELRIVALSSHDTPASQPATPTTATAAASAAHRKPDCVFDLATPTDNAAHRTLSLYLQPQSYTSVPARSKAELLEIQIHTPRDDEAARQRRVCLPAQLRTVLNDAEEMRDETSPPPSPLLTPPIAELPGEKRFDAARFAATCERVLQLVQSTETAS